MESFEFLKRQQLLKQDKSDEGHLDKEIIPLLRKINAKRDYYTTSSCAGRIVLIKGKEQKQEGLFLFKTHNKISFAELKNVVKDVAKKYKGLIYFKMEPCIMHVACLSLQKAQDIVDKAKLSGWKKSGIIAIESKKNRTMAELKSTEHISMPIAMKKILVSDDFLKILVKEANKKLARAREKIKKLEKII